MEHFLQGLVLYASIIAICSGISKWRANRKLARIREENSRNLTPIHPNVPHAKPPDEETAEEALLRKRQFYIDQAKAGWMGPDWVKENIERANQAIRGLVELFPSKYELSQ